MKGMHIYKKIYVSAFLIIIFTPLISYLIQEKYNVNLDRKVFGIRRLVGYTARIEGIAPLNFENYTSSKFQKNFTEFFEKNLPLKKVLIKTFSTLQFVLFGELNRSTDMVLGKDGSILTKAYIYSLLALKKEDDFSDQKKLEEMKGFIDDLVLLQDKLSKVRKFLYVYIVPGKVTIQRESIPDKYFALQKDGRREVVAVFDEMARKTNLHYMLAKDVELDPRYPPFYKTGIHWSRTYEQKVSQRIIEDIKRISNNHYGSIVLGQVNQQDKCFWRDCDMIGLSNAWITIPQDYYEYQVEKQPLQDYQQMKFLIYGDSFSLGLLKDIRASYPDSKLYHTTRKDLFSNRSKKEHIPLKRDFNNVNYKEYLDDSDGVIIEMTEPEIKSYTFGFVKHLIKILDEAK